MNNKYALQLTLGIILGFAANDSQAKSRSPAQDKPTEKPQEPADPLTAGVPHANPSTGGTVQAPPSQTYARDEYDSNDEKKNIFMVAGFWEITNQSVSLGTSTTKLESTTNQSNYDIKFLREVGDNVWFGPSITTSTRTVSSGGDETTGTDLMPAAEIRTMMTTKGNAYVALGGVVGWVMSNESTLSSGTTTKGSYSGLAKGAYIGLGNKVGEKDTYIVEATFGIIQASLTGTYSTYTITDSGTRFHMSVGIGHMF